MFGLPNVRRINSIAPGRLCQPKRVGDGESCSMFVKATAVSCVIPEGDAASTVSVVKGRLR